MIILLGKGLLLILTAPFAGIGFVLGFAFAGLKLGWEFSSHFVLRWVDKP